MPRKKIIEISITAILTVLLIFIVISAIKGVKKKTLVSKKGISQQLPVAFMDAGSESENIFLKLQAETQSLEIIRDPFSPAAIIREQTRALNLSGIIADKENPKAIINGIVVGIGDIVDGNRVVSIEAEKVILNDGMKDFELRLGQKK